MASNNEVAGSETHHQETLAQSQQLDKTILNSEQPKADMSSSNMEPLELRQQKEFFLNMSQPLSARLNDNQNICDRLDHDRLAPVTSEQDVQLSPAI